MRFFSTAQLVTRGLAQLGAEGLRRSPPAAMSVDFIYEICREDVHSVLHSTIGNGYGETTIPATYPRLQRGVDLTMGCETPHASKAVNTPRLGPDRAQVTHQRPSVAPERSLELGTCERWRYISVLLVCPRGGAVHDSKIGKDSQDNDRRVGYPIGPTVKYCVLNMATSRGFSRRRKLLVDIIPGRQSSIAPKTSS
eukprot:scaffold48_cov395-Prasinococcus_capsulatus_cf.AAC.16